MNSHYSCSSFQLFEYETGFAPGSNKSPSVLSSSGCRLSRTLIVERLYGFNALDIVESREPSICTYVVSRDCGSQNQPNATGYSKNTRRECPRDNVLQIFGYHEGVAL